MYWRRDNFQWRYRHDGQQFRRYMGNDHWRHPKGWATRAARLLAAFGVEIPAVEIPRVGLCRWFLLGLWFLWFL